MTRRQLLPNNPHGWCTLDHDHDSDGILSCGGSGLVKDQTFKIGQCKAMAGECFVQAKSGGLPTKSWLEAGEAIDYLASIYDRSQTKLLIETAAYTEAHKSMQRLADSNYKLRGLLVLARSNLVLSDQDWIRDAIDTLLKEI